MSRDINILSSYPMSDRPGVHQVILALLPNLTSRFMLVGGAAVRYGLFRLDEPVPQRAFRGLALVIDGLSSLRPEIQRDFLVHHLHMPLDHAEFRVELVHRHTAATVTIMPWRQTEFRHMLAPIGSDLPRTLAFRIPVQALSTQFAMTVWELRQQQKRGKLDPEQLADALMMQPHIDLATAQATWDCLSDGPAEISLMAAYAVAVRYDISHRLQLLPPAVAASKTCPECCPPPGWLLADQAAIRALLERAQTRIHRR